MGAQHGTLYFFWMRSWTRYRHSGDEMDCDGVIGETGVDDWVCSSCGDLSDNEGDLGFSDHEPVPEKNNYHVVTLPSKSG
jgi:hypothetical protein